MMVIPAIDLSDGQVVRLERGDMSRRTVYSDDPAEMARRWQEEGAERLHVVDLDGAMQGRPVNLDAIKRIVDAAGIPVDLGGTSAVGSPETLQAALHRFGDAISVSIDARDGRVAIEGWVETSEMTALEFASSLQQMGVREVVHTDIARDGMLTGPNLAALRELAEATDLNIIAAGGVKSLDDIRALRELEPLGVVGAITGRAIYTGDLNLREAVRVAAGRA